MSFKQLRSPSSTVDQSQNSRLSFATGDNQKDSGLDIEFMLDTGASCSIINYRTFWEIRQTQHPIAVIRSTKQTKTYSCQVVLSIGFATITFSYDPDGKISSPLTLWISEKITQNLPVMDFCRKQVAGIHFHLPGIELEEPLNTVSYGSLHQNKSYPFISQILTIRTPHVMNFLLSPFNRLLTVFEWENILPNFSEYVDQRPHRTCPPTLPILIVVQSTPLVRPKTTQQTRPDITINDTTSVQTPKLTLTYAISVYQLMNPDSVKPKKLTN